MPRSFPPLSLSLSPQSFNGDVLREPWEVLAPGGTPHATFEGYWAAASGPQAGPWPPPAPAPASPLPPPPPGFVSEDAGLGLDDLGLLTPEEAHSNAQLAHAWTPGARGAHAVLRAFVTSRLAAFDCDRAKADRASTSRLSPHLHWGEVSVRAVVRLVCRAGARLEGSGGGGGGGGGAATAGGPLNPATAAGSAASPRTLDDATAAPTGLVGGGGAVAVPAGSAAGPGLACGGGGGGTGEAAPPPPPPPPPSPPPPPADPALTLWRASPAASAFLRQVGFREYARYLCFHYPFSHERALLAHLRAAPWRYDQRAFKAWRQGRTGYPLVDAGMRELWATGWLHNRARVVCASFLVKHLRLPWQWGLKHFWDALVDADLECCVLGWQYVSGGLADAHPFYYMVDVTGGLGGGDAAAALSAPQGRQAAAAKEGGAPACSPPGTGGGGGGGGHTNGGPTTTTTAGGDPSTIARAVGRGEAGRYDPAGRYVRRWLPALARLPDAWIHAPWAAPARVLEDAGVDLGPDGCYPLPLISPAAAAEGLLEAAAAIAAAEAASGGGGGGPASSHPPAQVGPFLLSLGGGGGGAGAGSGRGTATAVPAQAPVGAAAATAATTLTVAAAAPPALPPPPSLPPAAATAAAAARLVVEAGDGAPAPARPAATAASCGDSNVGGGGGGGVGGPTPATTTAAASGGDGRGRGRGVRPPPAPAATTAEATLDERAGGAVVDDEVTEEGRRSARVRKRMKK